LQAISILKLNGERRRILKPEYLNRLTDLLERIRPRLGTTHELSFKSCFGAVAGFVDGNIFISCGRFGTALKLPAKTVASLLEEKGFKRLKYFPNGHVKKDYAVLPGRILQDKSRMKRLLHQSISFAVSEER
jgi:TfoX/Sxy family transcriptional regulator of competence genes